MQEESIIDEIEGVDDNDHEGLYDKGTPLTVDYKVTTRHIGNTSWGHPSDGIAIPPLTDDNENVTNDKSDQDAESSTNETDIIPSLKDNPSNFRMISATPDMNNQLKSVETLKTSDTNLQEVINSRLETLDSPHDKNFKMKLRSSDVSVLSSELSPAGNADLSARSILSSTFAMAHYRVPEHYRSILEHSPRVTRSMSKKLALMASGISNITDPSDTNERYTYQLLRTL